MNGSVCVQANEVLLFNRKLNAKEARERNLVSEVFPAAEFEVKTWALVEQYSKLPPQVWHMFSFELTDQ